MRLMRAMTMKDFRRRSRGRAELGDELGARRRRRRKKPKKKSRQQRRQQRTQRVRQKLWSEVVPLGENIRIQAKEGYRGAYAELRPGLYLVAELRTEGLEGEFGRKVRPEDVASEIFRVSSQALNTFMPRQQAQPQQAAAQPTTQALPAPQAQRALPAPQQQYAAPQQYPVQQQYAPQQRQQHYAPQTQYATAAPQQQVAAPQQQVATAAPQAQPAQMGPQSFLPPAAARWLSMLGDDDRTGGR